MIPRPEEIAARLASHIDAGDFPGAVVAVAKNGEIERLVAVGHASLEPQYAMHEDTIFDVASLTKPLITTTAILLLIQSGELLIDTRLGDLYDNCPVDKSNITVADLLAHCSGIESWYPLYAAGRSIAEYREFIIQHPLVAQPKTEVFYSDLNFILLANIVAKARSAPFSQCIQEMILYPLHLQRSFLGRVPKPAEEIAATEEGGRYEQKMATGRGAIPLQRPGIIRGETHDGNSWAAGGCAGNAGLFSTTLEVITLAEEYGPRSRLLSTRTRALVGGNLTPFSSNHRTLGWQLASSQGSSAGPSLSPDSIGHVGFTGTSLWFDRQRDIAVAILTNRIHPRFTDINMNEIRRHLHTFLIHGG